MEQITNLYSGFGINSATGYLLFALLFIMVILYIFGTLGVIALSKHAGLKYRYLAWIPNFNVYYLNKLSFGNPLASIMFILYTITGNIEITIGEKLYTTKGLIPENISRIITLVVLIFLLISVIKLYKNYSKNYILYTILTLLSLGLLAPIFLFVIRNNQRTQIEEINEEIQTNTNVYMHLNKDVNQKIKTKEEKQLQDEEEYDIRNSWDGPK